MEVQVLSFAQSRIRFVPRMSPERTRRGAAAAWAAAFSRKLGASLTDWGFMADSKQTMARLDRLEGAFVQITDLLVLQGGRLDSVRDEVRVLRDEIRTTREALSDRLDRLIAITTQERTLGIERLARIEDRVTRLEERVGI